MKRRKLFIFCIALTVFTILCFLVFSSGCGRALRRQALIEKMQEEETAQQESASSDDEQTQQEREEAEGSDEEVSDPLEDAEESDQDGQEADTQEEAGPQEDEQESVQEAQQDDGQSQEEVIEEAQEVIDEADEEDQEMETYTAEIPIVIDESGSIVKGADIPGYGRFAYAGDTDTNSPIRGYVSFDITGLSGAQLQNANIKLIPTNQFGDFFELKESLCISSVRWGTRQLEMQDFDRSGSVMGCYGSPNFEDSPESLLNKLQKAIDEGRQRFQICIWGRGPASNNDGIADRLLYDIAEDSGAITLTVTYTLP